VAQSVPTGHRSTTRIASGSCKKFIKQPASRKSLKLEAESIYETRSNVPNLLKQNRDKCIFLMEGYDLRCVLAQEIELHELLNRKLAHLNIEAEPYLSVASIRQSE